MSTDSALTGIARVQKAIFPTLSVPSLVERYYGGIEMISREKLAAQYRKEIELFEKTHPKSMELFERAKGSLLQGAP
jgi:hypothetical protein